MRPGLTNRLLSGALVACLFATSGCYTRHLVQEKARAHIEYDPQARENRTVNGEPGYYALVPLTVAADIITFPVQSVSSMLSDTSGAGHGTLNIRGVPVPMP